MIEAVRYGNKDLQMPPKRRLDPQGVKLLEKWIAQGAPWPGAEVRELDRITEEDRRFWSFQPVTEPTVPEVKEDPDATEIDRFVLARMRQSGLEPAQMAGRRTLIRRASYDLLGLPPTPAETEAFLADQSEDAWPRLIERLLDSPHYGERWGRHWLDVARYADTQGDVADYPVPWAWKYRNWVFRALNQDLPIDQFLAWQVAGDLIAKKESDPERARDQHLATGFVALSRRFGQFSTGKNHLVIEDTIDALGRGMLGLTLRCARCHNHKFDPIFATDYYALYGMFESTRYPTAGNTTDRMPLRLVAFSEDPKGQERLDQYWEDIQRLHRTAGRAGAPRSKPLFEVYDRLIKAVETGDAEASEKLEAFLKKNEILRDAFEHGPKWPKDEWARQLQNPPEDIEMVFGVVDRQETSDGKLHRFGQPSQLGQTVPRGAIEILTDGGLEIPKGESGRKQLAEWLVRPDHPLTARVFVNRVWQWHFGRGLVDTPDNFGKLGQRPSHPELLDWLAWTFVHEDNCRSKSCIEGFC